MSDHMFSSLWLTELASSKSAAATASGLDGMGLVAARCAAEMQRTDPLMVGSAEHQTPTRDPNASAAPSQEG